MLYEADEHLFVLRRAAEVDLSGKWPVNDVLCALLKRENLFYEIRKVLVFFERNRLSLRLHCEHTLAENRGGILWFKGALFVSKSTTRET